MRALILNTIVTLAFVLPTFTASAATVQVSLNPDRSGSMDLCAPSAPMRQLSGIE